MSALAPVVIELLRLVRVLREECLAYSQLLSVALERLHDAEREENRLRENYHRSLDEQRRLRAQLLARDGVTS